MFVINNNINNDNCFFNRYQYSCKMCTYNFDLNTLLKYILL